ncbi:hypothetical protein OIV83_002299 [Microbotryomycetes sp. JL201]|nr:hypothetical protein OIV83_002299 [Microbotryomycetes sp. JL201]
MNTSTVYNVNPTSLCSTCTSVTHAWLSLLPLDIVVIAAASCTALWLFHTSRPRSDKLQYPGTGHVFRAKTVHARYLPVASRHQFSYPVLFFGLDLDSLERHELDIDSRVFCYNASASGSKWQVCSIEPDVYFDPPVTDEQHQGIKYKLRKHLVQNLGPEEDVDKCTESVYTVTMPKYLGFQDINPLTVHFCYSKDRHTLTNKMEIVALEVSNTFGEKHLYTLRVGKDEDERIGQGYDHSWTFPRAFHVSPFNDRSGFYQVSVVDPLKHVHDRSSDTPRLDVKILTLTSDRQKKLFASLVGDGIPLTKAALLGSIARWPTSLLLTTPRILYQAAILHYRKWLDVFPRPEPFAAVLSAKLDDINPVEALDHAQEGGVQWQDEGAFTTFARKRTVAFLERRVDEMAQLLERRVSVLLKPANINIDPITIASSLGEGKVEKLEMAYLTPLMFDDLFLCPTPQLALELGSQSERRWFVNDSTLFLDVFSCEPTVPKPSNVGKMPQLRADIVKWGLSFYTGDLSSLPRDLVDASVQPIVHPFDSDPESTGSRAYTLARRQFRTAKVGYWLFVLFRARFPSPTLESALQATSSAEHAPVALLPPIQDAQFTFKIVVIGDTSTGKTSLRTRYTHSTFSSSYRATIGCDFVSRTIFVDGQKVVISVWDTAGQERFKSLAASFYRGADACLLVYSDQTSLDNLEHWFNEFKTRCPVQDEELNDFAWVAVGAKADMWEEYGFRTSGDKVARMLERIVPSQRQKQELQANGSPQPTSPEPLHCHRGADAQPHATPSKLRVKSRARECCGHDQKLRTKRSTISTTGSVYHTPSSTMRGALPNGSTESLLSEETVMPGTPSTSASVLSERDVFQWTDNEEHYAAEQLKESARGVDVFMATSPPHTPRSLLHRDRTRYKGGPSVFHAQDESNEDVKPEVHPASRIAPGGSAFTAAESAYDSCLSASTTAGHDFASDGIKHFVTSAKTGEGVEEVFDYLARRMAWKREKDEREQKAQADRGPTINLAPNKKRNKWAEACCT